MRIDISGVYANRNTSHAASEAGGHSTPHSAGKSRADNVTVSSRARLLALGRNALDAAPTIRTSVVEAARARLNGGADSFDGAEIARAMMDGISEIVHTSGETAPVDPASNTDRQVSES